MTKRQLSSDKEKRKEKRKKKHAKQKMRRGEKIVETFRVFFPGFSGRDVDTCSFTPAEQALCGLPRSRYSRNGAVGAWPLDFTRRQPRDIATKKI